MNTTGWLKTRKASCITLRNSVPIPNLMVRIHDSSTGAPSDEEPRIYVIDRFYARIDNEIEQLQKRSPNAFDEAEIMPA